MIVRHPKSTLGMILAKDVKDFMMANIEATKNDELTAEQSVERGVDMISKAIGFAVASAMSSTQFQTALNAGVIPPGGGIVGTGVIPVLLMSTKEA